MAQAGRAELWIYGVQGALKRVFYIDIVAILPLTLQCMHIPLVNHLFAIAHREFIPNFIQGTGICHVTAPPILDAGSVVDRLH